MRRSIWIAIGALVLVAGAAAGLAISLLGGGTDDTPDATARALVTAWHRSDTAQLAQLTDGPPAVVRATYRAQADDLGGWPVAVRLRSVRRHGDVARARFRASFRIARDARWTYDGTFRLARTNGAWVVHWEPAIVHPTLTPTLRFRLDREWKPRAPILAEDGTPLTVDASVVTVGAEPDRIEDRNQVTGALSQHLDVDPATIARALDAPGVQPDYFVPIVTVPESTYQAVKSQIYPVPGLRFRRSTRREAITPQLAAHVVGTTGPITKELLDRLGPPYGGTDTVGRSGLERAFETRLAGTPSISVNLVGDAGQVTFTPKTFPGTSPQSVRTTIDLPTQQRAEAALGATAPAALVAVRPSDGAIRAVVSTPVTEEFDRALDGAYPPGSTFKVVTGAALLANGTTPDTPTTCPPTVTVDGRQYRNFEGETEPSLTFRRAFAISCNTAFIGLARQLPADALGSAAARFGFGAPLHLTLAAHGGTFPTPRTATERAASAIGQAKVTASPVAMAAVAGTVASGAWHSPTLVLDPPPSRPAGTEALDPAVAANLRSLMTEVVRNGTGTAAAVSGQDIAGKTGTAEFGTDTPPKTHAWFIGFRDDLSFAVLVEAGGVGGRVAAPIAHAFLAAR